MDQSSHLIGTPPKSVSPSTYIFGAPLDGSGKKDASGAAILVGFTVLLLILVKMSNIVVAAVSDSPDVTNCPIKYSLHLVTTFAVGKIVSKSVWETFPKSTSFRIPFSLRSVICSGVIPASSSAKVLILLGDLLYI
jgi:hypothetical protein